MIAVVVSVVIVALLLTTVLALCGIAKQGDMRMATFFPPRESDGLVDDEPILAELERSLRDAS